MNRVVYCMWCGHILTGGDYGKYCVNDGCDMLGVLVALSYDNKPKPTDLRMIEGLQPDER